MAPCTTADTVPSLSLGALAPQRYYVPGEYDPNVPSRTLAGVRQRAREIITAAKGGIDLPAQEERQRKERERSSIARPLRSR
jgi:hypothetical protein